MCFTGLHLLELSSAGRSSLSLLWPAVCKKTFELVYSYITSILNYRVLYLIISLRDHRTTIHNEVQLMQLRSFVYF